jgi:hypothetical protein
MATTDFISFLFQPKRQPSRARLLKPQAFGCMGKTKLTPPAIDRHLEYLKAKAKATGFC